MVSFQKSFLTFCICEDESLFKSRKEAQGRAPRVGMAWEHLVALQLFWYSKKEELISEDRRTFIQSTASSLYRRTSQLFKGFSTTIQNEVDSFEVHFIWLIEGRESSCSYFSKSCHCMNKNEKKKVLLCI